MALFSNQSESTSGGSLPSFFWYSLILISAKEQKLVLIFLYHFYLDWFAFKDILLPILVI